MYVLTTGDLADRDEQLKPKRKLRGQATQAPPGTGVVWQHDGTQQRHSFDWEGSAAVKLPPAQGWETVAIVLLGGQYSHSSVAETGKTVSQVALRWVLQRPSIVSIVVGARNEAQLKENLGAVGWSLDAAQIRRLDEVSEVRPIRGAKVR